MKLKLITTKDGSHSIFNETLNTTYHSNFGALQESRHVFIKHGLAYAAQHFQAPLHLVEVGFGSGLNAMLSLLYSIEYNYTIQYTGIEKYPLSDSMFEQLNYKEILQTPHWPLCECVQKAAFNSKHLLHPHFVLTKLQADIVDFIPKEPVHLVYFDAFGPGITPEMWQPFIFERFYAAMSENACLVTFCAQGEFKRNLKNVGFKVETLPGAPGKREMTRAVKAE
jgi:tRNA U34 5-methylaminomethyl-2-thiouridine-forming methyltransferase MnmC